MGKALVITEKPSVARDIVAALGGFREEEGYWEGRDYVVTFSVGHIVELLEPEDLDPQYKRWTLDTLPILPETFRLKPKSGQSERIRTIKKLLARDDVERVVNACDAGREGELIFREILDYLASHKPTQRLWLQSMTPEAIRQGFSRLAPGEQYDPLGAAAACRAHSDWLIGMNATRALTRRLKSRRETQAWSAGRVQTPTLKLIVDRELEILSHEPVPYWQIEATLRAVGHEYAGTWFDPAHRDDSAQPDRKDDRIFDEAMAREIARAIDGQTGDARETRKPSRETAPPLFDLTSLQREGNRRFGWSARRTLNAAQRCYEAHKVLTYPRTDSRALPNDYRRTVDEVLRTFSSQGPYQREARVLVERGLQNTGRTFDDSKVSDHFAIIPTGKLPDRPLPGDDGKLFDLVARRFLATFYPPAVWNRVERVTEIAGHCLRSRSRTLDEPGWRSVLGQAEHEGQPLPPLVPGGTEASSLDTAPRVEARELAHEIHAETTRPPARITEAALLSLMENAGRMIDDEDLADALHEKGIGTPATRADIIENLIAKGYLARVGKALRPSVKGIRLIDILVRIRAERLASPQLTGELEHRLREVERGQRSRQEFMDEIADYTREIVELTKGFEYDALYPDTDGALGTCPCEKKRPVYERSWFYRCKEEPGVEGDADCSFRIWKDKSGRYIDRHTVRVLLEKGETDELEGFTTRDGRTYNGRLALDGLEVKLVSTGGSTGEVQSETPEYEVNEDPLGACPMGCGSEVVETPTQFRCRAALAQEATLAAKAGAWEAEHAQDGKRRKRYKPSDDELPCPFVLPRTVCKREITRGEAAKYVKERETDLLEEFTSRHGRPFSAKLVLKPTGRHGFEFLPRGGGAAATGAAPRRKAAGRTAARGSSASTGTRTKTTRKKATRKKTSRKGTSRKRPTKE